MKLYLDENISKVLAVQLRRRGFDVVTAVEIGMIGKSDEDQLKYATKDNRTFFTFDVRLASLAVSFQEKGKHHAGILISKEYKGENIGELVRQCSRFLSETEPEQMTDAVLYLRQFRAQGPL